MALLPMGPPIDGMETQESMFDDPTHFSDAYLDEGVEEAIDEAAHQLSQSEPFEPEHESVEPKSAELTFAEPELPAVQHELKAVAEPVLEGNQEASQETNPEASSEASQDSTLPLTVDDFAALEDRVLRAVNLVRRERQARTEAEVRVKELEAQVLEQIPLVSQLQQEVDSLRTEREQVRHRVERLLSQLDALEL